MGYFSNEESYCDVCLEPVYSFFELSGAKKSLCFKCNKVSDWIGRESALIMKFAEKIEQKNG